MKIRKDIKETQIKEDSLLTRNNKKPNKANTTNTSNIIPSKAIQQHANKPNNINKNI